MALFCAGRLVSSKTVCWKLGGGGLGGRIEARKPLQIKKKIGAPEILQKRTLELDKGKFIQRVEDSNPMLNSFATDEERMYWRDTESVFYQR